MHVVVLNHNLMCMHWTLYIFIVDDESTMFLVTNYRWYIYKGRFPAKVDPQKIIEAKSARPSYYDTFHLTTNKSALI